MDDSTARYLDAFPTWLQRLPEDGAALADALALSDLAQPARERLAAALNYLFKSVDLIPDGIQDLGYLDDAFIFRFVAASALAADSKLAEQPAIAQLAAEADVVRAFLGEDAVRLDRYVDGLAGSIARGRAVADVLASPESLSEFLGEVRAWADSFEAPSFAREPQNLVKLRSFLTTKLPA